MPYTTAVAEKGPYTMENPKFDYRAELAALLEHNRRTGRTYTPPENAIPILQGAYYYLPDEDMVVRALPARGTYAGRLRQDSRHMDALSLSVDGVPYKVRVSSMRRLRFSNDA